MAESLIALIVNYYLPPMDNVNRDYLRLILKGEKKLLKMDQVKMVHVPKYDELSVKGIYAQVSEDPELQAHLPDLGESSKAVDRQYFFNVVNSIHPEYLTHVIRSSQEARNGAGKQSDKPNYILISDDWYSQLTQHPFVSSMLSQLSSLYL